MPKDNLIVYRRGKDLADDIEKLRFVYKEIFIFESGKVKDIYLFEGNREWEVVDTAQVSEKFHIDHLYYMSWLGTPLKAPWRTVRWYGRLIYFKDINEFCDFTRFRWQARLADTCPICGQSLKRQLRFTFVSGRGIPFQLFFCSKDCLQQFMRGFGVYKELLKSDN